MSNPTFCFVDLELANSDRASICALGIICVSGGEIVFEKQFLINPECDFSNTCVRIHGIKPDMISDAPKFPEVWNQICDHLNDGILVAHNAASVECNSLCRSCERYQLPVPRFRYVCTMITARQLLPGVKCGLHELCDHLQIGLENHHDAMCDAKACRAIFDSLNDKFGNECYCVQLYDYSECASSSHRSHRRCLPAPSIYDCACSISVSGSRFCLVGDFASDTIDSITERIELHQGFVATSITKKTNYLVIGSDGSEKWEYGNYGAKIKKARSMQSEGADLKIIAESDLISALNV